LPQRRRQHHRRQDFEAQIENLMLSLQGAISPFIESIRAEHTAMESGLMVTLNYLLKRTQLEPFKQRYDRATPQLAAFAGSCQALRERLAPEGIRLALSGPWPPYHFSPKSEP
jgi:hypothetical protein